jgi:hypothetical protein
VEPFHPGSDATGPRGLELGVPRSPDRSHESQVPSEPSGSDSPSAPLRMVTPSPKMDSWPEEVAVCDLCGLVSRLPVPPVCPACGGGFG